MAIDREYVKSLLRALPRFSSGVDGLLVPDDGGGLVNLGAVLDLLDNALPEKMFRRPLDPLVLALTRWNVWVWVDATVDQEGKAEPGFWQFSAGCPNRSEAMEIQDALTKNWDQHGGMEIRILPHGEQPTDIPDRPPLKI